MKKSAGRKQRRRLQRQNGRAGGRKRAKVYERLQAEDKKEREKRKNGIRHKQSGIQTA